MFHCLNYTFNTWVFIYNIYFINYLHRLLQWPVNAVGGSLRLSCSRSLWVSAFWYFFFCYFFLQNKCSWFLYLSLEKKSPPQDITTIYPAYIFWSSICLWLSLLWVPFFRLVTLYYWYYWLMLFSAYWLVFSSLSY